MRLSLKELFGFVALFSLGLAGLVSGPPIAWVALGILSCIFLAMVINVLVASGHRRAFSIGFLVPASAYLVIVFLICKNELDPNMWASLPSTRLLQQFVRPTYTSHTDQMMLATRVTNAESVIPLGHLFIASLFGICGGYYGCWASNSPKVDSNKEMQNKE